MSPSKMRKTQWHSEGREARALDLPRDSNPYNGDPAHYVRRRAWFTGWDEEHAEARHRPPEPEPTPVEAILASVSHVDLRAERERTGLGLHELKARMTKDALASAVGAAETVADLRAILEVLIEEAL